MNPPRPASFPPARPLLIAACLAAVAGLLAAAPLLASAAEPPPVEAPPPDHAEKMARGLEIFKRHVRPLLVERCLACHGGGELEGDFNLATREGLLQGSRAGKVAEPGRAKDGLLYKLITHEQQPFMPYDGERLSGAEIARIVEWIDGGAPYDKPLVEGDVELRTWKERTVPESARSFWAFQPLQASDPPPVRDEARCRTPIDRFVLNRLEERGIGLNPEADRRTLIRRASFDLIGLPPDPEDVERFVNDPDPDAYDKLIDRLLANEHYGERWGRHWLDVARFAESHGFEQDYDRPYAYHYRDFVIRALNQDMPYDQFVRWQLAGDEFAPEDPLALMATGFLGAGVFPTQITAREVERTRYDALDDMAATTGSAFLGMSIGCARCHDHKFDPIPQADYYRFLSTFTTTVRSNVDVNMDPEGYRQAREAWDAEHAPLAAALERFERDELPGRLEAWDRSGGRGSVESSWIVLDLVDLKSEGGATLTRLDDGSILASDTNPDAETYTFVAQTDLRGITAVRLEALAHPSLVKHGPGRADNGNFALTDFRVTAAPRSGGEAVPVRLENPQATFEQQPSLLVAHAIDDDKASGWAVDPEFGKDHRAVFETAADVGFDEGTVLTFTLEFKNNQRHSIGRPRLAVTTAPRPASLDAGGVPESIVRILDTPSGERSAEDSAALLEWYRHLDPEWQSLHAPVQEHLRRRPEPPLEKVMVASEGVTPIRHHTQGADFFDETYYLHRGDTDQKDGVAEPGFLQVLMRHPAGERHWQEPPPEGWRTSYRRRALANWITDTEDGPGHLLARVIVNRMWQHHFGRGIVATPSDFGVQGEPPTHPELLDWLAADLIANGWRLKPLHKRMMTSAVYMQSADRDPHKERIDVENRWFWRREPRRLEAEVLRDALLAASGTLDRTMFGPGTLEEGHVRRSIYFMVKRSRLIPMMVLFDAPEPLVSVGDRPATTIAPQALAFMNNPHVRGWARNFARRLQSEAGPSPAEAVARGYRVALGRPPTEEEAAEAAAFLDEQRASYAAGGGDPWERALTDFCQVLMSLNEFVYVE